MARGKGQRWAPGTQGRRGKYRIELPEAHDCENCGTPMERTANPQRPNICKFTCSSCGRIIRRAHYPDLDLYEGYKVLKEGNRS